MAETTLKQRGRWPFIRKRLFNLIYIVGVVLSVIGSYQVYAPQVQGAWELVTNVLFSVIKLFLFAPTVGMDQVAPPAYELATWIAPLGTVIGFFQVFEKQLLRFRQWLRHERKAHLLVTGDASLAEIFLQQVQAENPNERLLYLVEQGYKPEDFLGLERRGIKVAGLDFSHPDFYENALLASRYRFHDAKALVCFDAEPQNFGKVAAINQILGRSEKAPIPTHLLSADEKAKEILEDRALNWQNLDVHFFNLNDLKAMQLVQREDFPVYQTAGLNSTWQSTDVVSEKTIAQKLAHAHVLIIGFGQLGQAVFRQVSNVATINTHERLRITIVDKNANTKFDFFEADIDQLEKVCDVHLINHDLQAKALPTALYAASQEYPFTALVFCLDDAQRSLLSYERLHRLFAGASVAVYCPKPAELSSLVEAIEAKRGTLLCFGADTDILNKNVLLNEQLLSRAKYFNAEYNRVAAELMGWPVETRSPEEQWLQLNTLKKESSLAQTLHRPSKRAIIEKLCQLNEFPDSVETLCERWRAELEGLSTAEQVNLIVADPVKNFLTELEHRRWNNFHYMRNFYYAEEKDLANKKHDCLIDDWAAFLAGPQRDKAIYDFLSILALDA